MQPNSRSFLFFIGLSEKKEHFIEYLLQVLWLERNRCQMLDHFRWAKRRRWQFFSLKMIVRPILPIKHWTYTYRRWNMHCIERITHLRNPISYIWFISSHIYSNNKGTLQFFYDFKENCRIIMEFSHKVDINEVFYCSVKDSIRRILLMFLVFFQLFWSNIVSGVP